jgi:hypothetical protein
MSTGKQGILTEFVAFLVRFFQPLRKNDVGTKFAAANFFNVPFRSSLKILLRNKVKKRLFSGDEGIQGSESIAPFILNPCSRSR